tara:strand:+ start:5178 stop:5399 length:222 start_codon:yes stop_codon:yes gene_type:complete
VRGTNRLKFQPLGGEMVLEEYKPADMCRVKPSTLAAAHGPTYWPVPSTHELNGVKALFAVLDSFRTDGEKMLV